MKNGNIWTNRLIQFCTHSLDVQIAKNPIQHLNHSAHLDHQWLLCLFSPVSEVFSYFYPIQLRKVTKKVVPRRAKQGIQLFLFLQKVTEDFFQCLHKCTKLGGRGMKKGSTKNMLNSRYYANSQNNILSSLSSALTETWAALIYNHIFTLGLLSSKYTYQFWNIHIRYTTSALCLNICSFF